MRQLRELDISHEHAVTTEGGLATTVGEENYITVLNSIGE
ncbi:hypothetical protein EDO6_01486 [Paenibacillus xylanexedens]|nr:hypothetical protein EDO6_01486 [Paenibacillus xylanexedens]